MSTQQPSKQQAQKRFEMPDSDDKEAQSKGQALSAQFQELEKAISTHIRESRVRQTVESKLDHLWESVKHSLGGVAEGEEPEDEQDQK